MNQRKQIYERELQRLDATLRPVSVTPLAQALSPYARQLQVNEDAAGNLWIFIDTGPGNTLDRAASEAMLAVFSAIRDFADFNRTQLLYISHRGKDFSLGGHRESFIAAIQSGDVKDVVQLGENFKATMDSMAELPCLIVGVAYGSARGGGMELLMATDLQFAWPGLKVGFPEVSSGMGG